MLESRERLFVSVDASLCAGCGNCVEQAPDMFTHVDGVSYIKIGGVVLNSGEEADVPADQEAAVTLAAVDCPEGIIMVDSHVVATFEV